MVIRAVTSFDVADNSALVSRLKRYYDVIDSSFSPVSVRFPWLPGPSIFQKIFASACVYLAFRSALHDRKNSRIRRQDALQQLLDAEESETCILKVRATFLFLLTSFFGYKSRQF
jgi:sterol 14-demethylase